MTELTMDERLREAISAAYANSTEVQARFEAAGIKPADVQTVAELARVPILSKDKVIELQQSNPPFGGLLAAPMSEISHIFFSPGPLYEPEAAYDSDHIDVAALVFRESGFEAGDIVLNSLSYHLVPAGWLVDRALSVLGCTVVPGGIGNSELQLKMMVDLGVTGYAGTPSFLMQLIQQAETAGLDFKAEFSLKKMVTTAEPLPPSLRQRFVEEYGLTVGNCYATAELGLLALDTAGEMAMRLMPEPIIQVVDPQTGQSVGPGEAGEVVVTNFSRAYPLIRFGTGDMALNIDPRPGASSQEERAIILVGRSGEAVKVRGMFVHPNQLRFAVQQVVKAAAFQGVITRPWTRDNFTLRLALAEELADRDTLVPKLKESVRSSCRVKLDEVEFVSADEIGPNDPGMLDAREWS